MHPKQKEVFWSAKLAYAVGLITTDGNLSSDGRHFDFTSNDIDLIETFKDCLGIKNKIARKRSGYTARLSSHRVQFGNVTLYDWLVNNDSKHNSIELIGRIYYEPGLPCLKRKFKIAQEFIKPG